MYILPLTLVILAALFISVSKNGIGSFVTLGIIGAAIYSIPAIADTQQSLSGIATISHGYVAVAQNVQFVVLMAWLALFVGLVASILLFPQAATRVRTAEVDETMASVAWASALLALIGVIYLSWAAQDFFFFLAPRSEQDNSAVALLWKWAPVMGLVAASLARRPKLLIFHGIVLFIIFMRGDRTLIAIAAAAMIVAASYKDPKWYVRLRPLQITGLIFGVGVVFLGKSIYIATKAIISGRTTDRLTASLTDQFLYQFEPLATFSHLEFVMRTGIRIGPLDFLTSVFGNLLLVPSAFGVSTNVYNAVVTSALSARLNSGIAGNYLAHGYTVAGIFGAMLFYFILPLILRFCDGQFRRSRATTKIFWCCTGAVIAFYIHRNGLDNELSFVRQLFVICVIVAATAAGFRSFPHARPAPRWSVPGSRVRPTLLDDDFALARSSGDRSRSQADLPKPRPSA